MTRFYTGDVISVGADEGIYVGRDQIRPLYQQVVNQGTVKIDSVYTYVNGDAGWDWTDFHVTPLDSKTEPFTFVILFLWTKFTENGCARAIFSLRAVYATARLAPSHP